MPSDYVIQKRLIVTPRLPLEGSIDLTYRCNNDCRHCWLKVASTQEEEKKEFSFEEIIRVVDEARSLGCRQWNISGGEPMLRPDFPEIFDYITRKAYRYTLNTNGTLITPGIAKLMKRRGVKLISLYGATKKVHDYITRRPGSFEELIQGLRYLKEADAGFMLQLVPMRANYHQFKKMIVFSRSLTKHYRIGAPWLYLSAYANSQKNKEILAQRLSPRQATSLTTAGFVSDSSAASGCCQIEDNGHFFSSCAPAQQEFHVDAYGGMSFCSFIKDPALRYNLHKGTLTNGWEKFIPSLTTKVPISAEYKRGCGLCALRTDCSWCSVYSYLEHRRYGAKIDYLCSFTRQIRHFKSHWVKTHCKYFRIAEITLKVNSELPFAKNTFVAQLKDFEVKGPGKDTVVITHQFSLPKIEQEKLGIQLYRKPPWEIYKKDDSWFYLGVSPGQEKERLYRVAVFNAAHTRSIIYNKEKKTFSKGGLTSLTTFPTDQILLARLLADRKGCILHACGVSYKGKGFLFVGHSSAGKSTIARRLRRAATILCDDRIIVRQGFAGLRIYGTWSHGEIKDVSPISAPLKAIFFLEQSNKDTVAEIADKRKVMRFLLPCLIKPLVTVDWWEKSLSFLETLSCEIPCYELRFKKSGSMKQVLEKSFQL